MSSIVLSSTDESLALGLEIQAPELDFNPSEPKFQHSWQAGVY